MTGFNALMVNLVKYGEKLVRGCVSPRGGYDPKGVITCSYFITEVNALMIILVKYGEQCGCFDFIPKRIYDPKE